MEKRVLGGCRGLSDYQEQLGTTWLMSGVINVQFPIIRQENLFEGNDGRLAIFGSDSRDRRLIFVDQTVFDLHGDRIQGYFSRFTARHRICCHEADESKKELSLVLSVLDDINSFSPARRSEPVIVIGGGVLMDAVGLAASMYRRGTPYIRVPTTLMGQIDASIGVKTGVNFKGAKNRLGSYYAPIATFIDLSFLRTMDNRQMSNGIAEIIKIAIVKNRDLFELLDECLPTVVEDRFVGKDAYDKILHFAIEGMLEDLRSNIVESELRRRVDFGHTFSPALEMAAGMDLLHGESVSIDMALSVVLAFGRGLMSEHELRRCLNLMTNFALPIDHSLVEARFLWSALLETTKHRDGQQRIPLSKGIGDAIFIDDLRPEELDTAIFRLKRFAKDTHSAVC